MFGEYSLFGTGFSFSLSLSGTKLPVAQADANEIITESPVQDDPSETAQPQSFSLINLKDALFQQTIKNIDDDPSTACAEAEKLLESDPVTAARIIERYDIDEPSILDRMWIGLLTLEIKQVPLYLRTCLKNLCEKTIHAHIKENNFSFSLTASCYDKIRRSGESSFFVLLKEHYFTAILNKQWREALILLNGMIALETTDASRLPLLINKFIFECINSALAPDVTSAENFLSIFKEHFNKRPIYSAWFAQLPVALYGIERVCRSMSSTQLEDPSHRFLQEVLKLAVVPLFFHVIKRHGTSQLDSMHLGKMLDLLMAAYQSQPAPENLQLSIKTHCKSIIHQMRLSNDVILICRVFSWMHKQKIQVDKTTLHSTLAKVYAAPSDSILELFPPDLLNNLFDCIKVYGAPLRFLKDQYHDIINLTKTLASRAEYLEIAGSWIQLVIELDDATIEIAKKDHLPELFTIIGQLIDQRYKATEKVIDKLAFLLNKPQHLPTTIDFFDRAASSGQHPLSFQLLDLLDGKILTNAQTKMVASQAAAALNSTPLSLNQKALQGIYKAFFVHFPLVRTQKVAEIFLQILRHMDIKAKMKEVQLVLVHLLHCIKRFEAQDGELSKVLDAIFEEILHSNIPCPLHLVLLEYQAHEKIKYPLLNSSTQLTVLVSKAITYGISCNSHEQLKAIGGLLTQLFVATPFGKLYPRSAFSSIYLNALLKSSKIGLVQIACEYVIKKLQLYQSKQAPASVLCSISKFLPEVISKLAENKDRSKNRSRAPDHLTKLCHAIGKTIHLSIPFVDCVHALDSKHLHLFPFLLEGWVISNLKLKNTPPHLVLQIIDISNKLISLLSEQTNFVDDTNYESIKHLIHISKQHLNLPLRIQLLRPIFIALANKCKHETKNNLRSQYFAFFLAHSDLIFNDELQNQNYISSFVDACFEMLKVSQNKIMTNPLIRLIHIAISNHRSAKINENAPLTYICHRILIRLRDNINNKPYDTHRIAYATALSLFDSITTQYSTLLNNDDLHPILELISSFPLPSLLEEHLHHIVLSDLKKKGYPVQESAIPFPVFESRLPTEQEIKYTQYIQKFVLNAESFTQKSPAIIADFDRQNPASQKTLISLQETFCQFIDYQVKEDLTKFPHSTAKRLIKCYYQMMGQWSKICEFVMALPAPDANYHTSYVDFAMNIFLKLFDFIGRLQHKDIAGSNIPENIDSIYAFGTTWITINVELMKSVLTQNFYILKYDKISVIKMCLCQMLSSFEYCEQHDLIYSKIMRFLETLDSAYKEHQFPLIWENCQKADAVIEKALLLAAKHNEAIATQLRLSIYSKEYLFNTG